MPHVKDVRRRQEDSIIRVRDEAREARPRLRARSVEHANMLQEEARRALHRAASCTVPSLFPQHLIDEAATCSVQRSNAAPLRASANTSSVVVRQSTVASPQKQGEQRDPPEEVSAKVGQEAGPRQEAQNMEQEAATLTQTAHNDTSVMRSRHGLVSAAEPRGFSLIIEEIEVSNVPDADADTGSDPFVRFELLEVPRSEMQPSCQTPDIRNESNPTWAGPFVLSLPARSKAARSLAPLVLITLLDRDPEDEDDQLCRTQVRLSQGPERTENLRLVGFRGFDDASITFTWRIEADAGPPQLALATGWKQHINDVKRAAEEAADAAAKAEASAAAAAEHAAQEIAEATRIREQKAAARLAAEKEALAAAVASNTAALGPWSFMPGVNSIGNPTAGEVAQSMHEQVLLLQARARPTPRAF